MQKMSKEFSDIPQLIGFESVNHSILLCKAFVKQILVYLGHQFNNHTNNSCFMKRASIEVGKGRGGEAVARIRDSSYKSVDLGDHRIEDRCAPANNILEAWCTVPFPGQQAVAP